MRTVACWIALHALLLGTAALGEGAMLEETLPNGARIVVLEAEDTDAYAYTVVLASPPTADASAPAARLALVSASFLGVGGHTEPAAAERIQQFTSLGGHLTAGAQAEHIVLGISGVSGSAELGFDILADAVLHPPLDDETVRASWPAANPDEPGRDGGAISFLLREVGEALLPGTFITAPAGEEQASLEAVVAERAACYRGGGAAAVAIVPSDAAGALARLRALLSELPATPDEGEAATAPEAVTAEEQISAMLGLTGESPEAWRPMHTRVTEGAEGQLALVAVAWPVPALGEADRAAVEVITELLAEEGGRLATDPRLRQVSLVSGALLMGDGSTSRLVVWTATQRPWLLEQTRAELVRVVEDLETAPTLSASVSTTKLRLLGEEAVLMRGAGERSYRIARGLLSSASVEALAYGPLEDLRALDDTTVRRFVAESLTAGRSALAAVIPRLGYHASARGLGVAPN